MENTQAEQPKKSMKRNENRLRTSRTTSNTLTFALWETQKEKGEKGGKLI